MFTTILILAVLGFVISLYDFIIEQKLKTTPDYKPMCDLSDRISCTKPMKSPYSSIFFISNAVLGMLFYCLIALLAFFQAKTMLLCACIGGVIASCIFAYFLYFKIKTLCLICTSLYIINIILLILAITLF